MPSFDVISKVNQQELTNAISNCNREISTRFDFKGLHIVIESNTKENAITVVAPDDLKKVIGFDVCEGCIEFPNGYPKEMQKAVLSLYKNDEEGKRAYEN